MKDISQKAPTQGTHHHVIHFVKVHTPIKTCLIGALYALYYTFNSPKESDRVSLEDSNDR